jgi:hypothetical protein
MNTQSTEEFAICKYVAPKLGATVDEVLRAFIRASDDWCGQRVVEALLPVTNEGPARKYRVQSQASKLTGSRIGVALHEGFCIRDATAAEEAELEECLELGFVQIASSRRGRPVEVLHQATGRHLPAR